MENKAKPYQAKAQPTLRTQSDEQREDELNGRKSSTFIKPWKVNSDQRRSEILYIHTSENNQTVKKSTKRNSAKHYRFHSIPIIKKTPRHN